MFHYKTQTVSKDRYKLIMNASSFSANIIIIFEKFVIISV